MYHLLICVDMTATHLWTQLVWSIDSWFLKHKSLRVLLVNAAFKCCWGA